MSEYRETLAGVPRGHACSRCLRPVNPAWQATDEWQTSGLCARCLNGPPYADHPDYDES